MDARAAFIALNRFGLGGRIGDLERIGRDPRGWLLRQIDRPREMPAWNTTLEPSDQVVRRLLDVRKVRRAGDQDAMRMYRQSVRKTYLDEAGARTVAAIETQTPFRERLVHFWSNHFTVSINRHEVLALAGAFEREAIRPHVTGRFGDMCGPATRHPAMLLYLDNISSIGPNSRRGRWTGRSINENHAREILELHTLGVNGGYTQADVRALAKILTGWHVADLPKAAAGCLHVSRRSARTRYQDAARCPLPRSRARRRRGRADRAWSASGNRPFHCDQARASFRRR